MWIFFLGYKLENLAHKSWGFFFSPTFPQILEIIPTNLGDFFSRPNSHKSWSSKRYFVTLQKQLSFNFYKYKLKFFKVDTTQADTEGLLEEVFCKGSRQNPQSRKKSVKRGRGYPPFPLTFFRSVFGNRPSVKWGGG